MCMGSEKLSYRLSSLEISVELRQLAVFVAVAEEKSLTRAAERQNVVQSAVSATLRTLERELGMALVARTTHKETGPQSACLSHPRRTRNQAARGLSPAPHDEGVGTRLRKTAPEPPATLAVQV